MLRKVRERLHPCGPFRPRPPVTLRERVGIMLIVPRDGIAFHRIVNGSQARAAKSSARSETSRISQIPPGSRQLLLARSGYIRLRRHEHQIGGRSRDRVRAWRTGRHPQRWLIWPIRAPSTAIWSRFASTLSQTLEALSRTDDSEVARSIAIDLASRSTTAPRRSPIASAARERLRDGLAVEMLAKALTDRQRLFELRLRPRLLTSRRPHLAGDIARLRLGVGIGHPARRARSPALAHP